MKKLLKILLSFIIFVLLAGVIVYIFAPQWYYIAYTKKFIIHDRILSNEISKTFIYTRATERNVPETTLKINQYITGNGIKLGVPFKNEPQTIRVGAGGIYNFENKKSIYVLGNKPANLLDLSTNGNEIDLSILYGKQAVSSNLNFLKTIFNMSPDDLTFKSTKKDAMALGTGLTLKYFNFTVPGPSPYQIIAFHSKKYQGIEFVGGNDLKNVVIESDDLPVIKLVNMTQEEIDTIINSIEIVK